MIGRVKDRGGVTRILNWVPSLPTRIPHFIPPTLQALKANAGPTYPPFLTLLSKMPPIRDQGDLGSCTAFSAEAPIWFAQLTAGRKTPINPSPLFLYYNERRLNGQIGTDAGANISDIFRATNQFGICDESLWPYDTSKFTMTPPDPVYTAASAEKAHIYAPIPQVRMNVIGCIHHGFPIDFGITVYDSFMSAAVAATGIVPMPAASESVQGGHAIDLIGYNDESVENLGIPPLSFMFRNSWGTDWGAKGYGFLPYDFVLNSQYASDFWMIRTI